jgi:hypothetical protein
MLLYCIARLQFKLFLRSGESRLKTPSERRLKASSENDYAFLRDRETWSQD